MATAAARRKRNPAFWEATDPEGVIQTLGEATLRHVAEADRPIGAAAIMSAIADPDIITSDGYLVRIYYQWQAQQGKWLRVVTRPALEETVRTAHFTKRIRRREEILWTR